MAVILSNLNTILNSQFPAYYVWMTLNTERITKFVFVLSLLQDINLARRPKAGRKLYCVELGINTRMIYVNDVRHNRLFPFAFGTKKLIFPSSSDVSVQKN